MKPAPYRVRRATVDDLPGLIALWREMNFPADLLEKRLTEFQLAETADGQFLGAVALHHAGRHGCVYAEAFTDFSCADQVRPLFWQRLEALALNQGLARLWTQEAAPFWSHNGFLPATAEALRTLPAEWQDPEGKWLTLQLREEAAAPEALDQQIQILQEQEKQRAEKARQRARLLKTLATLVAVALAIFVLGAAVYLLLRNPAILGR
jgi:N-acetylglutamate synthase-like GNAT family acetyltransferase